MQHQLKVKAKEKDRGNIIYQKLCYCIYSIVYSILVSPLSLIWHLPYVRLHSRTPAVRILPSYLELRMLERLEAAGRSPSRELLWSWAQQNKRVRDLQKVLQDMGHLRALQLFQGPAQGQSHFPLFHQCSCVITNRLAGWQSKREVQIRYRKFLRSSFAVHTWYQQT